MPDRNPNGAAVLVNLYHYQGTVFRIHKEKECVPRIKLTIIWIRMCSESWTNYYIQADLQGYWAGNNVCNSQNVLCNLEVCNWRRSLRHDLVCHCGPGELWAISDWPQDYGQSQNGQFLQGYRFDLTLLFKGLGVVFQPSLVTIQASGWLWKRHCGMWMMLALSLKTGLLIPQTKDQK